MAGQLTRRELLKRLAFASAALLAPSDEQAVGRAEEEERPNFKDRFVQPRSLHTLHCG